MIIIFKSKGNNQCIVIYSHFLNNFIVLNLCIGAMRNILCLNKINSKHNNQEFKLFRFKVNKNT